MLLYQILLYISAAVILALVVILIIYAVRVKDISRKLSGLKKSILSGIYSIRDIKEKKSGIREADIMELRAKQGNNDIAKIIDLLKESVRQESRLVDLVLDNIRQGVMVINNERKIVRINKSILNLFYLNKEDVLGSKTIVILKNKKFENLVGRTFDGQLPQRSNVIFYGDEEKHLEVEAIPLILTGYDKKETGDIELLIFFKNITQEVEFSRLRSQFVANISHEMRTPLTSIGGYLETVLNDDSISQKKVKDYLSRSLEEVNRLNCLIKDVLNLSNIEYKRNVLFEKEYNLVDIIKEIMESLSFLAKQNDIEMNFKFSNDPINYRTDEEVFKQMVGNIIENSIFYAGDGASLNIDIKEETGRILLTFTDNGIGIGSDEIPYIFQRFYRGTNPRSSKQIGSGLGLSIVKHAIDLHKGEINVTSIPHGETKFSMVLPKK